VSGYVQDLLDGKLNPLVGTARGLAKAALIEELAADPDVLEKIKAVKGK
jgi:hypothetical protein